MPAEAAQLEMADLNDWFGNFNGESIGHEEGPADVLVEAMWIEFRGGAKGDK